jgi:hypothetical protein
MEPQRYKSTDWVARNITEVLGGFVEATLPRVIMPASWTAQFRMKSGFGWCPNSTVGAPLGAPWPGQAPALHPVSGNYPALRSVSFFQRCFFRKHLARLVGAPLVGALAEGRHEACPYKTCLVAAPPRSATAGLQRSAPGCRCCGQYLPQSPSGCRGRRGDPPERADCRCWRPLPGSR